MSWIKIDFFGTRLRSWSFRFFCVTFFLLAYLSMHCEFLLREFCKPRWISTLNQKYLFVITSLTTTQFFFLLFFLLMLFGARTFIFFSSFFYIAQIFLHDEYKEFCQKRNGAFLWMEGIYLRNFQCRSQHMSG